MKTIGLDFGTHQTKICIEDAINPNQKTYEFFDFNINSKPSFFLPSVVQINEDNTISYGTVDEKKCKKNIVGFTTECIPDLQPPIIGTIPDPILNEHPQIPTKYSYPEKPKKYPYPEKKSTIVDTNDWKAKLLDLKNKMLNKENANLDEWGEECRKIDYNYAKILNAWQSKCEQIDKNHEHVLMVWESEYNIIETKNSEIRKEHEAEKTKLQKEFENAQHQYNYKRNQFHYLTTDENGIIIEEKLIFHYFKFALYSGEVNWLHQIDPETISIWYISNILFLLREKYGEEFFIQIGIPCGIQQQFYDSQKNKAICILIDAYNLLEKYKEHNKFLTATFEDLLKNTEKTTNFSQDDCDNYGINALPEAYAGLVSLTQKKKLEMGMNLLVDIGGGTTDIAFFTITEENLPDIHSVHSLYKGLNFIYENVALTSAITDIVAIQRNIDIEHNQFEQFEEATKVYKKALQDVVRTIIGSIRDSFNNSYSVHRLPIQKLNEAMLKRPVIFSGGGSTFKELVGKVESFSDAKRINQEMLSITNLLSKIQDDNMFSILSTAYGLSIPLENEIILTDIKDVFNHIKSADDEKTSTEYDHGLTDY